MRSIDDNRFRHGKRHFELSVNMLPPAVSGMRFENAVLDPEVVTETVLVLTDTTPFAHRLKREPFELRLNAGTAETSLGPVLWLLWWVPPLVEGKPSALYKHILNPTGIGGTARGSNADAPAPDFGRTQ